ncbi:MAG: hypothetical protein ACLGSA_10855 [Acidobacteriota bacterium]
MASIRDTIETTFAALAFAERDQFQEARDLRDETRKTNAAATVKRPDNRPRVRV